MEFELGSLNPQAFVLPTEPTLLVKENYLSKEKIDSKVSIDYYLIDIKLVEFILLDTANRGQSIFARHTLSLSLTPTHTYTHRVAFLLPSSRGGLVGL